jgi:hypothetical protein
MACPLRFANGILVVQANKSPAETHKNGLTDSRPRGSGAMPLTAIFLKWGRRTMPRFRVLIALPFVLTALTSGADDDSKKTRVGTCNDAKSQMEYFCNPDNAASDSMVAIGTACTNAKSNVKEACEGIVEPDKTYEFGDKKNN